MVRRIATGPTRIMRSLGNVRPETVYYRVSFRLVKGVWEVIPPKTKEIASDSGIPRIH